MTVSKAVSKITDRYNNKKKGWTNAYGYQCVALMQVYLNQFEFKDGWLDDAWDYGQAFKKGFAKDKTVMGLSPKNWQIVTKGFKKGDVLFFKPTSTNQYGHVAIAISKTKRLEQNMVYPFNGSYPYITSNNMSGVAYALRKRVAKPTHKQYYTPKNVKTRLFYYVYAKDKKTKIKGVDRGDNYIVNVNSSSSRNTYDAKTGKKIKNNNIKDGAVIVGKLVKLK